MSLWILVEGRRQGGLRDRIAYDYLANRSGELWYEKLARVATGRLDIASLRKDATTAPRRAELLFYGVTLGLDPIDTRRKLAEVVAARMVMDAEYDLARRYLADMK